MALTSPPPLPMVVKPIVTSRTMCSTMLQFVRNSLPSTHWKSSASHRLFHRFRKVRTSPRLPAIVVNLRVSSRQLCFSMPQFVRNSPITHWKSSPNYRGFHRFRNAPHFPTLTRDYRKANSLIAVTVFHHTAISVELSPIDSLEILSSHGGFHRFRSAPHLPTPTPDGGKANGHIADTVFHCVATCAELWPIDSLEFAS